MQSINSFTISGPIKIMRLQPFFEMEINLFASLLRILLYSLSLDIMKRAASFDFSSIPFGVKK
jgi:hypothetical protein